MKNLIPILLSFFALQLNAQIACDDCPNMVSNPGFEIACLNWDVLNSTFGINNIPQSLMFPTEGPLAFPQGCVLDWECDHGTADLYGNLYQQWYNPSVQMNGNLAHLAYSRGNPISEGIKQDLDFFDDPDLTYCLNFDAAKISDAANFNFPDGRLIFSLQNDNECEHDFLVPQDDFSEIRFRIGNNFRTQGLQSYSANIRPTMAANEFQFHSRPRGQIPAGILLDNIDITCTTSSLLDLDFQCSNGIITVTPILDTDHLNISDITSFQWSTDDPNIVLGNTASITFSNNFSATTVTLSIMDNRGCCATVSVMIPAQCLVLNCTGYVGNQIWCDATGFLPNVFDGLDTPIEGALITLVNSTNSLAISQTTTNGNGNYLFQNVCPGNYIVVVNPGQSTTPVPMDAGTNDAVDSDLLPTFSQQYQGYLSSEFNLADGEIQLTIDGGFNCGMTPAMNLAPNPATQQTTAMIELPSAGEYELVVMDRFGNIVWKLPTQYLEAGNHEFTIDLGKLKTQFATIVLKGENTMVSERILKIRN